MHHHPAVDFERELRLVPALDRKLE